MTWDENTAYRLQILHPRVRYATGVIWLTDMAQAGPAPARLLSMQGGAESAWVLSEGQIDIELAKSALGDSATPEQRRITIQ